MSSRNPNDREHQYTRHQAALPRTPFTHMTDEEFLRMTWDSKPTAELLDEYRARLHALVYANGVRGAR